jgi:anti-sigma regulatory factor (Ser/Thr protein kinase)
MENVEVFRSFVVEQMEQLEARREKVLLVELGLEEFLTNVVKYAYPQDQGEVEVECCVAENGMFCISIRDWGLPFNPFAQEDPDLSEDLSHRKVGGLGIYLVRKMFDKVSYEHKDGGNVVTLCCRR